MPRFYKRKRTARKYLNFTESALEKALEKIRAEKLSTREAAKLYDVSRSTLQRRLNNPNSQNTGRSPVLALETEDIIVDQIITMSDWGFPLSSLDLRHLIQNLLNNLGVEEPRFTNNLPGREFVYHFLKRHPTLMQ